jgi:hypothetical protein
MRVEFDYRLTENCVDRHCFVYMTPCSTVGWYPRLGRNHFEKDMVAPGSPEMFTPTYEVQGDTHSKVTQAVMLLTYSTGAWLQS